MRTLPLHAEADAFCGTTIQKRCAAGRLSCKGWTNCIRKRSHQKTRKILADALFTVRLRALNKIRQRAGWRRLPVQSQAVVGKERRIYRRPEGPSKKTPKRGRHNIHLKKRKRLVRGREKNKQRRREKTYVFAFRQSYVGGPEISLGDLQRKMCLLCTPFNQKL